MELDQEQYKKSQANDQLEKPFDADFLRDLIKKYVSEAPSDENPLTEFLSFPDSPPADEEPLPSLPETELKEDTSEFNLSAIFGHEEDSQSGKSGIFDDLIPPPAEPASGGEGESWESQDLSKFKIDPDSQIDNLEKFEALNLGTGTPKMSDDLDEKTDDISPMEPMSLDVLFGKTTSGTPLPRRSQLDASATEGLTGMTEEPRTSSSVSQPTRPPSSASKTVSTTGLNDNEIEAIVRAHTEEIIKAQVQNGLLNIVEKVVREELNKILEEEVRLKQELSNDRP